MVKIERESINFKLPKSLCDALRAAAEQRNTTATDLVIQGLHHILGDVPGVEASVEVRLDQLEEEFWLLKQNVNLKSTNPDLESRLTALENKLSAMSTRLAQFEGAITQLQYSVNSSKSRKSGYPYQFSSQPPQLQPLDENKLALRLNTTVATLTEKRTTLSSKEFESWTRDKDSIKRGWQFNEKDGLYHEVSPT